MKRGAEHQLSKDDGADDEIEEVSAPTQGFQKADESVLATRKIRALPKRSMGGTASPPPPLNGITSTSESSRFGGFAGFGTPSNSTPFSFTPPPAPTSSVFGSNSSPSVAPSASSATKTFASYLGSSSINSGPSSPSPVADRNEEPDSAALTYYSSLRGLNVSVLSAISKAIEADPFVDIADVLERYKSLRVSLQKEFDERRDANKPTNTSAPAATSWSTPTSTSKPEMPAPPSSFAGFGPIKTPSTSSPATGGFVPKIDNASSSGPFPATSTSTSSNSAFPFSIPDSSSKTSLFGSGSTTNAIDSSGQKSTSNSSTPMTAFESTNFSPSGSAGSPLAFGFLNPSFSDAAKSRESSSTATSASSNPFSKTSTFGSIGTGFSGEKSTQPSNPFSGTFGSGSSSKPSPFGSFAKPSGSIGNPVGFGFGSPPKASEVDAGPLSSSKATANGFGFGAVAPAAETQTVGGGPDEDLGDAGVVDETEDGSKLLNVKTHDQEGEGEEDEETTHVVRVKVFRMAKNESKWTDLGVGMLRLKKHKVSNARRVLLRNSSTGKIIINFIIYAGLNPSSTSTFVSFVGHEEGAPTTFKLRLKTEADAGELRAAMDREIALVQVKTP